MKVSACILSAIVGLTVLSLASPLAAADEAGKSPMTIGTRVHGNLVGSGMASGRFILDLSASSDSGKLTFKFSTGSLSRTAVGQSFRSAQRTETLKGKSWTLIIRSAGRQFPAGLPESFGLGPVWEFDEVWTGTWSIVSGTGRYAGLEGGGGVVGIIHGSRYPNFDYLYHYEGMVTKS